MKYSLLTFVAFVLAISYVQQANSAVIGLDLGGEYMKVSSISPGKSFYIVEDTTTKRKTPASIGFYNHERIYEYDTYVKRPRAFQTTFFNLNKFFGKKFGDKQVEEQSKYYLEDYITESNERGTISFNLKNFKMAEDDPEYKLTVEELAGMIFRHVKDLAVKQTEKQLRDIAVTVPPYWTFVERYSLHDALLLADLNPLAFITENTAAALYYSLERQDDKPHTIILFNLGSVDLKVSLIELSMQNSTDKADKGAKVETIRVLADAWERDVGGLSFDLNLVKHFAKEFDSKPQRAGKKSLMTSNPAKAKLLKEVNRLKEILSANKQASIYLENVFDSSDLKSSIDRAAFDEVNSDLYARLTKPIDEVLAKAGKTLDDIDAFELIGGGIRVPSISKILSDHIKGKEVGTHLNGDESMTLGASFHAANLSSSFKTRTIHLSDGYNFDIRVELKDLEPVLNAEGENVGLNKQAVLFPQKMRFGSKKILAFDHDGDLTSSFYATLPGKTTEELVANFVVTGLKEAKESPKYQGKDLGTPKVNLHYRLSNLGFIELLKAEAVIEEIILYEEVVKKNSTEKSTTTTDGTTNDAEDSTAETPADTTQEEKKLKKKTVTHTIPLKITVNNPWAPMTDEQLEKSRDLLSKFDQYEEIKKKTAEAKNKLEAYLYTTRDHLEDDAFSASAKEEEKEQLKTMLVEFDDWLFGGEGSKAGHSPLTKKYEELHKIVNKVQHRVEQRLKRPEMLEKAQTIFQNILQKITELADTKPWITEEQRGQVTKQVEEVKSWIAEMHEKQEALLHHEDPVFTTNAISAKVERVKDAFTRLKNTVKPKAPKNGTIPDAGDFYEFGKDGKFDEEKLKEYMKKMNITYGNTTDSENTKTEGDSNAEKNEDGAQTNEEPKETQEEPKETQEEPKEPVDPEL